MTQHAKATVLQTQGLSVSYGPIEALRNVSIRLEEGQIVTVIGPNGAGKSTLLNAIMGALPLEGQARGDVLFRDQSIAHHEVDQRLVKGLALVPEKRDLFTSMSVEDNLVLGAYRRRKQGWSYRDGLEQIYTIFPRLKERRKQLAGTMSGGERQMVAIGRALMSDPTVLMLDEPSLGLAPRVMAEVFDVITHLRDHGVTTLLIEQNSRAALEVSDYGYVLELGDVTLEGTAADLAHNPRVIEAYLGARH